MFDGIEQFQQFLCTPSNSIQTPPNFVCFDPLPIPTHHQPIFQSNHHLTRGEVDRQEIDHPWSNDEVVHLLRIKSTSENWFRDFTWDHVSRKLAEMGYKRSAEKCKEKFEEETFIGYNNKNNNNRYLITEDLDEHLFNTNVDQNTHPRVTIHESPADEDVIHPQQKSHEHNLEIHGQKGHFGNHPSEICMEQPTEDEVEQVPAASNDKKRKRKHNKFKMVKGLCVDLLHKMMAQQEEMHKKLLQHMLNRDQQKIKREEAWRKEETERLKTEIHIREHEHEMAKDRQSTITEFLNKITSLDQKIQTPFDMSLQDLDMTKIPLSDNPNYQYHSKDDTGKRWPRDEVLALINTRSNVSSGNNEEHNRGGSGSLWERISQGMLELGYKRSAKRCKEKWENINKYFRKTKDTNKKRPLDSRTCPYYHELTKLYNQDRTTIQTSSSNSGAHEPQKSCPTTVAPQSQ